MLPAAFWRCDNCDSPATLATMLAMKGRRTFIDERKQRGLKPQ